MSGADLSGLSVLILDKTFLLADDTRCALEGAGAQVLGPCPDEASALQLLKARTPDCCVLDINFGEGPSYAVARELRARRVPLVFLTGYDEDVLPQEFARAVCLQKPADLQRVAEEVARVAAPA